jgi:hypothetical protein
MPRPRNASSAALEAALHDRALTIAFAVSLGLHLLFFVRQWRAGALTPPATTQFIYERTSPQHDTRAIRERVLRQQREPTNAASSLTGSQQAQIRIPDRSLFSTNRALPDVVPQLSSVIDLTDLTTASGGDPVLLSYFGTIRQQIQQVANRRPWTITGEHQEGLVYIAFVLSSTGAIEEVGIVSDRSISSAQLRDISLRIVKAAAPFAPFPPSMTESSKRIIVPLEFLFGS